MNVSNGGQRAFKDQSKIRNNAIYGLRSNLRVQTLYCFFILSCTNSKAMISHVITVISKAVVHLSLGQIIVNAILCVSKTNLVDSEGYCRGI